MRNNEKKKNKLNMVLIALLALMIMAIFVVLNYYIRNRIIYRAEINRTRSNESYNYHFAMIVSDSEDDFWTNVYQGAMDEAILKGAYIELFGNELYSKYSEAELVEIAIASNIDGIIIETDGSAAVNSKIQKARKNGIPVVTLLRDVALNSRICYVGISNYNLGQEYSEQIAKIISEKQKNNSKNSDNPWNVMILADESINDTSQSIIYATIQDSLTNKYNYSNLVNIEVRTINSATAFETEEAIRNLFLFEEIMPDIILCLDETNSECVYQALVDYNQVGNIEMIGFYTNPTILSGIDKDIIYSTAGVDTYHMGVNGIDALIDHITTGYSSDYYSVDTYIINKDNISEYYGGLDE